MTSITPAQLAVDDPGLEHVDAVATATRLRNVLRVNAPVSGLTGLVAAIGASPVADLLGVSTMPVRIVGVGLVVFALDVGLAAGTRHASLPRLARLVGAADVSWVVATVALLAAGVFDPAGVAVAIAVGLVVAVFAVLELQGAAAVPAAGPAADTRPPVEAIVVKREVDAPSDVMWEVVTDHELYGRLAPNLGRVEVTSANGPGLTRRCYDGKGRGWAESCTLWDEGRRFAVAVDTSDYPYPLAVMRGSWWVDPVGPSRTSVGMTFAFQPRPGWRGRAFAWLMHAAFPPILTRILRGWQRAGVARAQKPR